MSRKTDSGALEIPPTGLPIEEAVPQIMAALRNNNTLVVTAAPGAGKSTVLPLRMLQDATQSEDTGKILILEPRRLAARAVAERMAQLAGEDCGQTVGYKIRFENRTTAQTRIEVLTEGILTRQMMESQDLEGVSAVIFDEFHERSLNADIALALCRDIQRVLRPDLKIVVMSATIDVDYLTSALNCPAIAAGGRPFPVSISYSDAGLDMSRAFPDDIARATALTVNKLLNWTPKNNPLGLSGDINVKNSSVLVFLPGEAEIRKCEEILRPEIQTHPNTDLLPLYGALPMSMQWKAIRPPAEDRRKIVLATPIAETSLTIDGVSVVVDTGLQRVPKFSPNNSLQRLETALISRDMATQRAGRAGRTGPGVCVRLYGKATENQMEENRQPEILTQDLAQLRLVMAQWGVKEAGDLPWVTPPPNAALRNATDLLIGLDAITPVGRITPRGKQMAQLPCHPRIAQMLLAARELDAVSLAADIAALLDERDPLQNAESVDINLRIDALRRHRKQTWQKQSGFKGGPLGRMAKAAEQYRLLMRCDNEDNTPADPALAGALLAAAYPDRIAAARDGNGAHYLLVNGTMARLNINDYLSHEKWIVVAALNARDGAGNIFLAAAVDPQDLRRFVKSESRVQYDEAEERVKAEEQLRIGCLVLQSKPLNNFPQESITECLLNAVKDLGTRMIDVEDEEVLNLRGRIATLTNNRPDEYETPFDLKTEPLVAAADVWLAPYLTNAKTLRDVRQVDLCKAILSAMPYNLQADINRLCPARIQVPSGKQIKLKYNLAGTSPVLAVRLQECFGMTTTPTVLGGRLKVLMHLLSPGFKLVQITTDMEGFWTGAYIEIRKELRNRYPKHKWPEKVE